MKLLEHNPQRKHISLWLSSALETSINTIACVAPTEAEANDFVGALVGSPGGAGGQGSSIPRFEFSFVDELWIRPCLVSTTGGLNTTLVPSTTDVIASVLPENWSR